MQLDLSKIPCLQFTTDGALNPVSNTGYQFAHHWSARAQWHQHVLRLRADLGAPDNCPAQRGPVDVPYFRRTG